MKLLNIKIFNISLLFALEGLFSIGQARAQSYLPFPESNAVWNVRFGGYQSPECSNYSYTITGDTVIGSNTYHKLTKKAIYYPYIGDLCNWCCPYSSIITYAGAIRQDTTQRKVYFLNPSSSTDTLLYDFNLQVGDTLPISYINPCTALVVDSIDSILIGNQYRRRMNLSTNFCSLVYCSSLIDGIGSTCGLLESTFTFEWGGYLVCFKQNGQTLYPDTTTVCDLIFPGIKEFVGLTDIFTIYPNPFDNILSVNTNEIQKENSDLSILNLLGQKVYTEEAKTSYPIILNLELLPQGIYILQILSNQHNYIFKIMKR